MRGVEINPAAADAARAHGIEVVDSVAAALAGADACLTSLPKPEHVSAVYGGDDGIFAHAEASTVLMDTSTVDVETSRGTLTALPRALDAPAPVAPVVRMLPSWDHFLLGWSRGRELTVPAGFEKAVHPGAGHLHPAFVVDGMVAGTWRFDRKRSPVGIVAKPFRGLTGEERAALEAEAEDVRRFLGLEDDPLVVEAPAAG